MKREIKFRAFLNSKYYEKPRMLSWGELLEQYDAIDMFQRDLMTLMQYTGLKDKNGREIYEGDIVHAYDQEPDRDEPDYRGSEATGIVEFHGSMFMLDDDIVLDYPPILEVIGNIFENTEMLEEEQ